MIIKNSKEIRKIYVGSTPTPSLNYNNSRVFRYVVDESSPSVDCPDVVQSIVGYEGDAKEVYAKDTEKWYMRNNLGNYEEHGILEEVQTLASATFYEGKLVIFGNHEYESIGGEWFDLGAVQGTTKKIKSPSYIYNDSSHLFSIPVGYTASTDTKFIMKIRPNNGGGSILGDNEGTNDQNDYRIFLYNGQFYYDAPGSGSFGNRISGGSFHNQDSEVEFGNYYIKNLKTGSNVATGTSFTYQRTSTLILGQSNQYGHMSTDTFQLSALTMYHGDTLARDFIPAIDGNDICLYDKVSDAYFKSDNGKMPLSGGTITEVEVGTIEYPKDYETKDAPEDNVTVESLDQIECPYEGMTAYVDGVRYVYTGGEWVEKKNVYLTFKALENGTFKFSGNAVNYSLDSGKTWNTLASNTSTPTVTAGQEIMFKAELRTSSPSSGIGRFSSTGRFEAMGCPYSLCYGDDSADVTDLSGDNVSFHGLFWGCTGMTSAENLLLPAITLHNYCYGGMFRECTSLTTAPELPATTLADYCYEYMFYGCSSLTEAPELPATSVRPYCYYELFYGCSSLTKAPDLNATELQSSCYSYMFKNCSSINYIKMMSLTVPTNNCFDWVNGVASSGTFVKNKDATWQNGYGTSDIPNGWTVVLSD